MILTDKQIDLTKDFIFREGRLLERKLFEYFFENGSKRSCVQALQAYQNPDGGFGNGIEPDLLCPTSTAIGAETAMYILDVIDYFDDELFGDLINWIVSNQNLEGYIPHPPATLGKYPHQPWWSNPDDNRILVLAGLLKKWGVENDQLFSRARVYYLGTELPGPDNFYAYPFFVYLRYCSQNDQDRTRFENMLAGFGTLLELFASHFPLLGRYWYFAGDLVENEILIEGANAFIDAIQDDGGVQTPYPDLPWWRPIFTLDGLIQLKKWNFI